MNVRLSGFLFLTLLLASSRAIDVSKTIVVTIGSASLTTVVISYHVINNTITMNVQAACGQCWVGIGWHGNDNQPVMGFADYVVAYWDNATVLHIDDRYLGDPQSSEGGATPDTDLSQGGTDDIFGKAGQQFGGVSSFTFSRLLVTNDTKTDVPLDPTKDTRFLVAFGATSIFDYHDTDRRQIITINLSTGAFEIDYLHEILYVVHGCLMFFSYAICMTFGIFVARFLRHKVQYWFNLHVLIQSIAILASLCAFGIAISLLHVHFDQPHAKMGYFIVSGSVITGVLGIVADRMYDPTRSKTPFFPDKLHWWVSRLVVILGYINIILGILDFYGYNPGFLYIYILYVCIIAVVLLFMEWQLYKSGSHSNSEGYAPINEKGK